MVLIGAVIPRAVPCIQEISKSLTWADALLHLDDGCESRPPEDWQGSGATNPHRADSVRPDTTGHHREIYRARCIATRHVFHRLNGRSQAIGSAAPLEIRVQLIFRSHPTECISNPQSLVLIPVAGILPGKEAASVPSRFCPIRATGRKRSHLSRGVVTGCRANADRKRLSCHPCVRVASRT